ncbi:MAG: hypothetical protein WC178_01840 [Candidatus Paceibacterota bacterium]
MSKEIKIKTDQNKLKKTTIKRSKKVNGDKLVKVAVKKTKKMEAVKSDKKKKKVASEVNAKTKPEVRKEGKEDKMEAEKYFAKWTAPDFLRTEDETLFYKISFVAAIIVIVWAARDGSWVTLVTFASLLVVILFELRTKPREIEYGIDIDGISIGGRLYKFEEVRSFDLVEKNGRNIVQLQLRNSVFPIKELHLEEHQDLDYMQALLEYFLPQEKQEDVLFNFKDGKKLTEDEFIDEKVNEYLKNNS